MAGVLRFGITHESSVEDFDLQIAVNLKGPFLMARAAIPSMLANGGGAIITVAIVGRRVRPGVHAGLAASKGGVAMFSRAIAWEYQKLGDPLERHRPGRCRHRHDQRRRHPRRRRLRPHQDTAAPGYKMMEAEEPAA